MDLLDVKLSTDRLLLKPISIQYKQDIFLEFTQEITTYMHPRPAKDILETEVFINNSIKDRENGSNLVFVVLTKLFQEFLGCAGIHNINRKDPELGIWLKKVAHGNKYGLEAIAAIKDWADTNLEYEFLRYPVDQANIASRNIPEALGGKVIRKYDKTNMSRNTLHLVEYKI